VLRNTSKDDHLSIQNSFFVRFYQQSVSGIKNEMTILQVTFAARVIFMTHAFSILIRIFLLKMQYEVV